MRILYSHRIASRDGQAVHVEELIAALRADGHEILVVGPGFHGGGDFGAGSRRLARLRRLLPGVLGELAELAYAVPAAARLSRAYRTFRPDLVYERCNLFHLAGAWLARRHGALLYLEVNAPLAEERARHGGLRLARLARRLEHWTWRSAARVLPVTRVLGDRVEQAGVPRGRIEVIPNAIVAARYAQAAPARGRRDGLVLGFVGFVRPWHGLDRVIGAMADAPDLDVRLVVVGDGPARPCLEAQVARHGLRSRVRFMGVVAPARIPELLGGFDIALQPQVTPYASPLKLFDYMAAGCAIVAPDQPNIHEVLAHERTALLFDPQRPPAMWQAIRRLAEDAALRERLGRAARACALQNHTWEGNARRVVALARQDQAARAGAAARATPAAAALPARAARARARATPGRARDSGGPTAW